MSENEIASKISEHYHRYPYPNIPLVASIPREQLWQINFGWLARRCGIPEPASHPKIWITGAGTFQPYSLSQANPKAQIFASDISESSLKIAKRRCFLHRKTNLDFKILDLNRPETFPQEKFDWIECYGVLMSLQNPLSTLKEFSKRLSDNGMIRLMVYPHYGRQRIFQIQEIAKNLSLTLETPGAPRLLKKLIQALPDAHPLKYAFFHYEDTVNEEGIADAFLHPNDRAFTGIEISSLIEDAGLEISYCMHRPWGQPKEMGEKLLLAHHDPALWLHYLDLWQSLRSNFILCLRKKNADYETHSRQPHELLNFSEEKVGMKHRLHLARISMTGTRLQTRTLGDILNLTSEEVREVLSHSPKKLSGEKLSVFPGQDSAAPLRPLFQGTSKLIQPNPHFYPHLGALPLNPLYSYLFDAYLFGEQWKRSLASPLAPLANQVLLWKKELAPLEDAALRFGLTPLGTYLEKQAEVDSLLKVAQPLETQDWEWVRLEDEEKKFKEVKTWLKDKGLPTPKTELNYRKLWILLFSHPHLKLSFLPS